MGKTSPVVNQLYLKDVQGARQDLLGLISTKQLAPLMLRLAFHDAGNHNAMTKTGGANGSVRFQQELKQGPNLITIVEAIKLCEQVKRKHPRITYADLYQLAGAVAVEFSGGPHIDLALGRPDVDTADEVTLPNPRGGADHLRQMFYRMGLNDRDIVALSGAHTLGRAHQNVSGFNGPFTRNPLKFDNSYFLGLMLGDTPGLVQFPSDKALVQDPRFRPFVELYAADQGAFFRDYARSHKKMSELGFVAPRKPRGRAMDPSCSSEDESAEDSSNEGDCCSEEEC